MTRLRILTGKHAGACLDWSQDVLTVGSDEDLDVYVGDWNSSTIELRCDDAGQFEARWPQQAGDAAAGYEADGAFMRCRLEAWVPVSIGGVVLCIGPSDKAWPEDVELLRRHFAPTPQRDEAPARRKRPALLFVAAATGIAVIASTAVIANGRMADKAALPARMPLAQASGSIAMLKSTLGARYSTALDITQQGPAFVVRGVVDTRADLEEVNRLLDTMPARMPLTRRYAAAPAVMELVNESMPGAGLSVERTGQRRFEITGRASDLANAEHAIALLSGDLKELGVELLMSAQGPAGVPPTAISGTLIDRNGMSFARMRNGVKHIVMADPANANSLQLQGNTP